MPTSPTNFGVSNNWVFNSFRYCCGNDTKPDENLCIWYRLSTTPRGFRVLSPKSQYPNQFLSLHVHGVSADEGTRLRS